MSDSARDYHSKRARHEARLAAACDDPAIARSHRDLARLHRMQAEAAPIGQRSPEAAI